MAEDRLGEGRSLRNVGINASISCWLGHESSLHRTVRRMASPDDLKLAEAIQLGNDRSKGFAPVRHAPLQHALQFGAVEH